MSTLADLEATFASRPVFRRFQRALAALVAVVMLAGGTYPALYASQLPHAHQFIGGPPPANWENHEHENPLDVLLGRPDNAPLSSTDDGAPPGAIPTVPAWSNGRVVSMYVSSVSIIVITVIGYAVIAPIMNRLRPTGPPTRFYAPMVILTSLLADGPAPPPPR